MTWGSGPALVFLYSWPQTSGQQRAVGSQSAELAHEAKAHASDLIAQVIRP